MPANDQSNQSANNSHNHFSVWGKPVINIISTVIGSTIALLIGIWINRHFLPYPPPQQPPDKHQSEQVPAKTTHDTPEKIITEIQAAPPLQRSDIAKTYQGIPVAWQLSYRSGRQINDEYSLLLRPVTSMSMASVVCRIPRANNDHFRRLAENTIVKVSGTIETIDSSIIYLKNSSVSIVQE